MKFIGQYIQSFIARFRSDVYLEDIDTGTIASGGNLGLDSNNKIVKATVSGGGSGDLTAIVAGTGLSGTSLTGPIPTLNVDAAQTGITSLGTLSSLAVTSASDLGSAAMTLTNADLDQIALDINASNTTANVIDISAVGASSGNVIFIDSADAVNEINIDKDYPRTTSHTGQVIKIASDKTTITADGQTYSQTGLISSVSDGGRNHANATNIVVNQDLTSNMGYADGTTTLYGIKNTLTGAADTAAGIYSNVGNDLGPDIYMVDSADTTNYCRIATTTNGALNITTHDQSGSDANVGFAVDGTFSVASTGIDIAADGTITNAAWQGTSIGTAYTDAKVTSILAGDGINVSGATGDVTVTAETATSSNPGIVELATDGETTIASDSTRAVTPASLGVALTVHGLAAQTGKNYRIINCNFRDDIGTTPHYLPLKSQDEQIALTREEGTELAVCDGRLVSATVRVESMATSNDDFDLTIGVETNDVGDAYATFDGTSETETISVNTSDDHHLFHFVFDTAKHWDSTDMFAVSIQSSEDHFGTNERFFVTLVIEDDWSTYLGIANTSSTEIDSTP